MKRKVKSIRKTMWGVYWKLHDKRKQLVARLKGYLDGLPPETRRRIVLGMLAAFTVLALYTFGRAIYDIGKTMAHAWKRDTPDGWNCRPRRKQTIT